MKQEFCVLIMAGGKGTRFWPKSTEEKPKQFLNLIEDETMIQLTVNRLRKIVSINKIFISTGEKYKELLKEQIPDFPDENIIVEPVGRNTAPCILLASLYIKQIYNNCNIAVLPSDHLVKREDIFLEVLQNANKFVKENKQTIVTIGITPNRPEVGYGYIKYNKKQKDRVIKVEKFVEKPDLETARKYLEAGEYLWNAGMFIFCVDYMLKELEINCNQTFNLLKQLPRIDSSDYKKELKRLYSKAENISIDYAVMEKSENIYVIPTDFGWDDIGTWKSLERYISKDSENNISKGEQVEFSNATNCIAYGGKKRMILIDVDGLFVVEGDDTIIICKKENMDKVKSFRK